MPARKRPADQSSHPKQTMLAKQWLANARHTMEQIENTQMDAIRKASEIMADSIEAERWVHTFGCGHATLPIEEMYGAGRLALKRSRKKERPVEAR